MQKEINQLKEALKQTETEKNNIELTLSRRQDDYMDLNENFIELKTQTEQKEKEYLEMVNDCRKAQAESTYLHNQLTAAITDLSSLLSTPADEEKSQSVKQSVCALLEEDATFEAAVSSLVDSMVLIKQSAKSAETTSLSSQQLASKQEDHIQQLEEEIEQDKRQIERLQHRIAALESSSSTTAELDEELEELEETNENLRKALRNAKENMEEQMSRTAATEAQLIALQQEVVTIQETSNQMVQQAFTNAEAREQELKKQVEDAEKQVIRKDEELGELKASWERSVEQYEQELAVLRARKVAVEQQVSINERFIDDHTKIYQTELQKKEQDLEEAQQEIQELKCQVLEREAELESTQQAREDMHEQLQNQIASLTEQVRAMQTKLVNQQSSILNTKKKEMEVESQMKMKLAASIKEIEEKDKEIIRQQQKNYEDEVNGGKWV